MLTIDQFVQREVVQCVSSLVSTLAQGYGSADFQDDIRTDGGACLMSLAEQAFKLASPIDDWEEAALQAGYSPAGDVWLHKHDTMAFAPTYRDAQEACEQDGIEPYAREVFEHWSVTPWLAERLITHGEKVDTDFAGMCVWARTTTRGVAPLLGQQISADYVIGEIYRDLMAS